MIGHRCLRHDNASTLLRRGDSWAHSIVLGRVIAVVADRGVQVTVLATVCRQVIGGCSAPLGYNRHSARFCTLIASLVDPVGALQLL